MKPPQRDTPLIEVETIDGRVVDLYNEYRLRSTVMRGDELIFEFAAEDSAVTSLLRFFKVRELSVLQPEDWALEEADQIEHLLVRRTGPWRLIVFRAGGLEYEFDCAELRLEAGLPTD